MLADSRHDPTADDVQMIEFLHYHTIPFTIVLTKADKLSKMKPSAIREIFKSLTDPEIIAFAAGGHRRIVDVQVTGCPDMDGGGFVLLRQTLGLGGFRGFGGSFRCFGGDLKFYTGIPDDGDHANRTDHQQNGSHDQTGFQPLLLIFLLLAHFFRYTLSSLVSAILDEGLFALLSFVLQGFLTGFALTAVPTAAARLISSLFNFFVNKKYVFRKNVSTGKALLRYYALAIPTALAQMGLTYGVFALLGIGAGQTLLRALIYGIVMVALFIFTFMVQQRWVFTEKK